MHTVNAEETFPKPNMFFLLRVAVYIGIKVGFTFTPQNFIQVLYCNLLCASSLEKHIHHQNGFIKIFLQVNYMCASKHPQDKKSI